MAGPACNREQPTEAQAHKPVSPDTEGIRAALATLTGLFPHCSIGGQVANYTPPPVDASAGPAGIGMLKTPAANLTEVRVLTAIFIGLVYPQIEMWIEETLQDREALPLVAQASTTETWIPERVESVVGALKDKLNCHPDNRLEVARSFIADQMRLTIAHFLGEKNRFSKRSGVSLSPKEIALVERFDSLPKYFKIPDIDGRLCVDLRSGFNTAVDVTTKLAAMVLGVCQRDGGVELTPECFKTIYGNSYAILTDLARLPLVIFLEIDKGIWHPDHFALVNHLQGPRIEPKRGVMDTFKPQIERRIGGGNLRPTTGCPALFARTGQETGSQPVLRHFISWPAEIFARAIIPNLGPLDLKPGLTFNP